MAKSTRVPRVSIAVTILDDPEFITLCQTPEGREAWACFTALIAAAKVQDNAGRFTESRAVIAYMIRWPIDATVQAIDRLVAMPGEWLVQGPDNNLTIRSFDRWNNEWGGRRRRGAKKSRPNQDGVKMSQESFKCFQEAQLDAMPASASASASASSHPSDGINLVEAIYQAYPRHVGKDRALPAIEKAIGRIEATGRADAADWLLGRVTAYAKSPAGQSGQFTPHPTTWFNRGSFNDDDSEWQRGTDEGPGGDRSSAGGSGSAADARRADKARRMCGAGEEQPLPILRFGD